MDQNVLDLILDGGAKLADFVVDGQKLSDDAIKTFKSAYCEAKIWGADWIADSSNTLDDSGLELVLAFIEDTLEEAEEDIPFID